MKDYLKYIVVEIIILIGWTNLLFSQCLYEPSSASKVDHTYFSLEYSEEHEQAKWVCYQLTSNMVNGTVERTDNFREDYKIKTGSASLQDYKGSGYDRGHLAPAADFTHDYIAMSESFLMSNMSPQNPSFNRGIWSQLESTVRSWAGNYGIIHIVTGPVLSSYVTKIGPNRVSVPEYYYKAILRIKDDDYMSIAFLIPNSKGVKGVQEYAVSVDQIETLTGLDLFHEIPDNFENEFESRVDINAWSWSRPSTTSNKTQLKKPSQARRTISVQCSGTTKKGSRCKNKTLNASGYCHLHDG